MVKKKIVIFSLILLCSSVVKASAEATIPPAVPSDFTGGTPSTTPQDSSAALAALAGANNPTPSTPPSAPSSSTPTTTGIEDKLRALLGTVEERAVAVEIALRAHMGDVTAAASAELAKAESFGASEVATVKAAIANYGNVADRSAAVDQMLANIETEARAVYAQCATAVGPELTVLEAKAASLATVRTQLTAAKNDIVNSVYTITQATEAEAVKLFGYLNASNSTHRTMIEVAAGVGLAAIGTGVVWGVGKITGLVK